MALKIKKNKNFIDRSIDWGMHLWEYFNQGVWEDPRRNWKINLVKTLNLSMRSFLNSQLWIRAASLTYNTVLAIVPALALIFAICRGFGFQNLLENQLHQYFPAQSDIISLGLRFVDSYLDNASEGLFVGVGILFLLWTLFSLLGNVEDAFNDAWNVKQSRTWWRKLTDYTAIFFVLPILLICSSGITVMMSSALQYILPWEGLKGAVTWLLDSASVVLIWLFFTGTYLLIPNTSVRFVNALFAGIITGTGFLVLQWIFVTGQMYVAKYNAIYGSFSFLPLLLIWLQLVWLITLAGASVCYAMQNMSNLSYINKVDNISISYREQVALAVMTVIAQDFDKGLEAPTVSSIARHYCLPINLVTLVVNRLQECGLIREIAIRPEFKEAALVPSMSTSRFTVGGVLNSLDSRGDSGFIPGFGKRFEEVIRLYSRIGSRNENIAGETLLTSISIAKPTGDVTPSGQEA